MKILVWDKSIILKNCGGPAGYLWNMKQFINKNPDDEISFYSDLVEANDRKRAFFFSFLLLLLTTLRAKMLIKIVSTYFTFGALSKREKSLIKKFDYVHFHSIASARAYNKYIQKLGCKTILTLHSPEPVIDEESAHSIRFKRFLYKHITVRNYFIKKEIMQLNECNYLMFPVPEALECYTNSSDLYNNFFNDSKTQSKTFFVPTCIPDIEKVVNCNMIGKLKLPPTAKILCYVGRHTTIKGYDYLKEIAIKLFEKDENIYVIVGGKEDGNRLLHDRWLELGWVNTNQLIQEVDVFILPNQQTYFDLIALEIIRAGVPLVTTLTGGNKYLSKVNSGGISFIPKSDAKKAAEILIEMINGNLNRSREKNRELFLSHFEYSIFVSKYKKAVSSL